jgi:peptide/nickel transport system ATP-binding protein
VERGACVALVGESGSGKTTIGRVIAGLHPAAAGQIRLNGELLASTAVKRSVQQRRRLQIIFQNPYQALNPRHTIAASIARPALTLRGLRKAAADAEITRLLEAVRLPARVLTRYPRELSGGERQRVAIARALAADPQLIVCDEITSSLDVSVQAVVLELLRELRHDFGLSLIFITHDLGVVSLIAERALVLNRGAICEQGLTSDLLTSPQHDYTQRLLKAAPSLNVAIHAWDSIGAPADAANAVEHRVT